MAVTDGEATDIFILEMADEEDWKSFQTFINNPTSSLVNDEDHQKFEEIKADLINSLTKYANSSTSTSNDLPQENVGDKNNTERQQQLELRNDDNNSSMNSNPNDMDVSDGQEKLAQIYLNVNATINNEQHFDNINKNNDNTNDTNQYDQTSLPSTTDNTYTGEQQMNALEYICQFFEKLNLAVNTWKSVLVKLTIPVKTGDYYLKDLQIPLPDEVDITGQDPLNKLSNLFQTGIHLFPSFRPICNTDSVNHTEPIGKESNESSERATTQTNEHNGSHLDRGIQAPTEPNISSSCAPENSSSSAYVNPISQLLLVPPLKSPEGNSLINLKCIHPPKHLWHPRYITDLAKKECPPLQSIKQRKGIIYELLNIMDYDENDLFVLVQLLTYDNKLHASKIIVPPETTVTDGTVEGLVINDAYGWHPLTNTILYPYKTIKYANKDGGHQIQLKVFMFNRYQDKEFGGSNHTQGSIANDKEIKNHQRDFIEKELHKIFKLRIAVCKRTATGKLVVVSEIKDTDLIKENQGTSEELKAIDQSTTTPKETCECGNEEITIRLNDYSEKAGFIVMINKEQLASHEFIGGNKKIIQIKPPPKTPDTNDFHLFIGKINVLQAIVQNLDPHINLVMDCLLDVTIKYADHRDNNSHQCFRNKKQKSK